MHGKSLNSLFHALIKLYINAACGNTEIFNCMITFFLEMGGREGAGLHQLDQEHTPEFYASTLVSGGQVAPKLYSLFFLSQTQNTHTHTDTHTLWQCWHGVCKHNVFVLLALLVNYRS